MLELSVRTRMLILLLLVGCSLFIYMGTADHELLNQVNGCQLAILLSENMATRFVAEGFVTQGLLLT